MITRISISIDGTSFNRFESFTVSQNFDNHHIMDIVLDLDDVNEGFGIDSSTGSVNLGKLTQDWAGKKITVTVSQGETDLAGTLSADSEQVFEALITEIQLQMRDYVDNSVTITALSPSIVLQSGENTFTFAEMTLSDIITKVLKVEGWQVAISPTNNPKIAYVTQYRESVYNFVQRLAKKYGEWFLYDGSKFVFGKSQAKTDPAVELEYGSNLVDMSYETKLVPLKTQAVFYDYFNDEKYIYESSGSEVSAKNYAQTALQKSLDIYDFKKIDLTYQNYLGSNQMVDEVKNSLRMTSTQLAVLKGRCTCLGLYPGSVVSINDDIQLNGRTLRTDNYGNFLVVKTYHYVDSNGHYQNSFEAIPDNPDFPPTSYPLVSAPVADCQPAIVKDTNDPEKMGRVKVHFPWQAADYTTPWIRVANLMAGPEQGVYFIPEKDEVILVDFESGNPDMPFVRGSMYNGSVKPGNKLFEQNNNFKGIITKGGNHILIDDTGGKENIKIYNKENKNEIELSLDGGSHIHIKSNGKIRMDADSIEMNAKNITIKAEEDLKVNSKNSEFNSDYSTTMFSENSTVGIGSRSGDVAISSPTEVRLLSDQKIALESKMDVSIDAQMGLTATAMDISMEGTTQLAVKSSGMATIDGGQLATIKGTFVMIN